MIRRILAGLTVLLALGSAAQAGWSVGVSLGFPCAPVGPPCRPHCHAYPYYPYYPVRPVYVAPAPVVVQQAPIYQTAPVYQAAPVQLVQPVQPQTLPAPTPVSRSQSLLPSSRDSDIVTYLQQLQSPDHRERVEAATQLGRLRSQAAVDSLVNCLTNDRQVAVREACARSLGQIGGPRALDGLQRAAQADGDRDVRQSASLAADIIRAQYQQR